MKCSECGCEFVRILFQLPECINHECKYFSYDHMVEVMDEAVEEFDLTDEELDKMFVEVFRD